jgi:hypothetical protein
VSAFRFWELSCDAPITVNGQPDICGAPSEATDRYLRAARAEARREGWTRGPDGEDYCPQHPAGGKLVTYEEALAATATAEWAE